MPNKKHEFFFSSKKPKTGKHGAIWEAGEKEAAPFAQALRLNMDQHWEAALDSRTVVSLAPGDTPCL